MAKPLPSDVFRLGEALTPEEKLVLLALIDYGARIYPSQGTLALKTGYCVRTIRTVVKALREKGVIQTSQRGAKALTYSVVLNPVHVPAPESSPVTRNYSGITPVHAARDAAVGRHPVPINAARDAAVCGKRCSGILTSQGTSQPNQAPATAGKGGEASPWDGIDQEDQRKIRRWVPRDTDTLCEAQRRVTLRKLADLGIRVTDHARWWRRLGERWGQIGVPPYDQLALELQSIGTDVRDRVSVLAFRLGLGRVAA
jgi:hypothetical protein